MPYSPNVDYRAVARRKALKYGLDPHIFERQIGVESVGYSPAVISGRQASPAGAQGIAQFMPATARGLGVDPLRPVKALDAAARLMAGYVRKYGSYEAALRAYNAGPGAIQRSRGFAETNRYVSQILRGRDPGRLGRPRQGGGSTVSVGAGGGGQQARQADLGESTGAVLALLQQMQAAGRGPRASAAPAPPVFSASPVLPQGFQVPAGGGGGASAAPGIDEALDLVRTVGGPVSGKQAAGGGAGQAGGGRGQVEGRTLVVGDSLGVGTLPQLQRLLGKGRVDGNVVGGRPSRNGVKVLGNMLRGRSYRNIIFDLGTNDATAHDLRDSLAAVVKMAPNAQIYVPTINSPFQPNRKNRLLQNFAAAHPNVHLVPWRSHSQGQLAGDGIHATGQGYASRAELIARTLGWSPAAGGGGGSVARQVLRPHGHWKGSEGPTVALFKRFGAPLGLQVMSNKRHNTNPYSGSRSDHDYGNEDAYAIDASNGSAPTPQMDEYAYRVMHALGFKGYRKGTPINVSQGVRVINGLRFQVIYRGSGEAYGGNHLNHVHVGVKRVG